jgi:hypothetical protein
MLSTLRENPWDLLPFFLEGSEGEEMESEKWMLDEGACARASKSLEMIESSLANSGEAVSIAHTSVTPGCFPLLW